MNHLAPLPFTTDDLDSSIPMRFHQVCQQLPADHPAYVGTDGTLTYQALAAASQKVAATLMMHLGQARVCADQKAVALFLPHNTASLIGIMGVLQTGHFFVPLDLIMGEATLQKILRDCPPQALVTTAALQPHLAQLLPPDQHPPVLYIEEMTQADVEPVTEWPVDPQLYASIQYTSGSTGSPRGVIRTHATHLNTSHLNHEICNFQPSDRVSHLFSYSLAMSNADIFGGLLNGATLVLHEIAKLTPSTLYHWLAANQITQLRTSIGMLRGLAALAETHPPLTELRAIASGGEVMRRPEVEQLCRLLPPGGKLVIRLASTEAGTYAKCVVEAGKPWQGDHTAIGTLPLNHQVMIVDENRQPVAAGETGEIAVRSRFSPGYWQRPAKTAAKFQPDPDDCRGQIFFTGDTGRMTADGQLEFLGRTDFLVKIRGYRVQLEEVEAALNALPAINEATVIARATSIGEKQLIAYYTAAFTAFPTADTLRRALLTTLPTYMVPARFIRLDALPRTASGKIDRAALPPLDAARPALGTPFVAPRNDLEQQLADIWAELLELESIGIDDNFFELGGDSLTAMGLILKAKERYKCNVPPAFFRQPTVAGLAQLISGESPIAAVNVSIAHQIEPHSPASEQARSTRHRLHRLIHREPLWHGHVLPYGIGVRMQQQWIKIPSVRQTLQQQSAVLRDWFALMGRAEPDEQAMELSMLANSWRKWRELCIQQPAAFSQWVRLHGVDKLDAALTTNRPIILVSTHTAIRNAVVKMALQQRSARTVWTLGDSPAGNVDAIAKVIKAREILHQDGLVFVAGDGAKGTKGVELPFCGRRWLFRSGGAELALDTDAIMLPVFNTLARNGQITVSFCAPLISSAQTRREQVADLTHQYAALLESHWPSLLSNMKWGKLQTLLSYTAKETT